MTRNPASKTLWVILVLASVLLLNLPAWGQAGTASLGGQITDSQGAAIPAAKVSLTNVDTKVARETQTDGAGRYLFAGVPPGVYALRVTAQSFRVMERPSVELSVNTNSRLNVTMEVGAVSETVTVSAAASPVNTTDATIGQVIGSLQVMSLPLEARSAVALLTLQPGVVFSGSPTDARTGSVNGGRSDQANVTLDGVDVNDQQTQNALTTSIPVPLASLQEFRFTTSNPTADQGRSSGGQIALITKSGTNNFHGSAFWTHRNTNTTANDFFNNRSKLPVPKLIRNSFGGAVGGPIIHDRFFFFVAYEGLRTRSESNELRIVPTDSVRQGVVSYLSGGQVRQLSPADLRLVDPAGLGVSQASLALLNTFPRCNDFSQGLDATGAAPGLNFCGFRFNAPVFNDNNIYVAKLDYVLTRDGRHSLSARGTLNDQSAVSTPQQFPGQPTASTLLDNSKGLSVSYSAALSGQLTNTLRWGYTRLGKEFSGQDGTLFNFRSYDNHASFTRALLRQIPTNNLVEDATWVKGSHTLQGGINFRWIRNERVSFANSFNSMTVNDGFCRNLCNDLPNSLGPGAAFPQFAAVPAAARNPFKRAAMAVMGVMTTFSTSAIFDGKANVIASGKGVPRRFAVNEYEYYLQDTWRATQNLTLTFGVRYGRYGVPYETNGLQAIQTVNTSQWFNQRLAAMQSGAASASVPVLRWDLAGLANNKPGYFANDENNFAPSFSFAYSPGWRNGWLGKLTGGPGRTSIRGGFRVVYDRVGGSFVVSQDLNGAFGLVSPLSNRAGLVNYGGSACTTPPTVPCMAPRFTGLNSLPAITNFVTAPAAQFPVTPSETISNRGFMIDSNLRTPYSYAVNLTVARELPGNIVLEASYISRLGHKLLAKADLGAPLIYHRDPQSGQILSNAMNQLYAASNKGAAAVSTVQPIPYFENVFPGLRTATRSATQGVYALARGAFPSFTDGLIGLEGEARLAFPTWFQQQFDSLPVWTNLGGSRYHALQVTTRKRFSRGLLVDFNYTWGRGADNASTVENTDRLGGQIADAFFPRNGIAWSSFDVKHQMSTNWVYELPVGRGRWLGRNMHPAADVLLGGWQVSGIVRWRGAFPLSPSNGFNFPTNYFLTSPGTLKGPVTANFSKNHSGGPNLFGATDAEVQKAFDQLDFTPMGGSGSRSAIRGNRFTNTDFGVRKSFRMPWEGHKLEFDWQVFNLWNHPNFDDRSVSLNPESRSTFGRFSSTIGGDERSNNARVMQFQLTYVF